MEEIEFIAKNLEIICRTCLQTSSEMKSIFSSNQDEIKIANMIKDCNFITLHESDKFPQNICINCIENVKRSFDFKRQCENSFKTLYKIIGESSNDILFDINVLNNSNNCKQETKNEYTQTEIFDNYICEICDSKYETNDALLAHRNTHKGDELKCKKCSKVYTRLYQYERHISTMHPEMCKSNLTQEKKKRSVDSIKSESIDSKDDIENSNTDITAMELLRLEFLEVKTEIDDDDDDDRNSYRDHEDMLSVEDIKPKPKVTPPDIKPKIKKRKYSTDSLSSISSAESFVVTVPEVKTPVALNCEACDKVFYRLQTLLQHERKHQFDCEKKAKCDLCPLSFVSSHSLAMHKRKEHEPKKVRERNTNEVKTEFCEICNKGFTHVKYLKKHGKTHQPRKCKMCDEVFTNKADLLEHKKTHKIERPFLCTQCGKGFKRNDFLEIHLRRHLGEKPFKCRYCEKCFPSTKDVSLHERYHTGKKPHICTICGKGFPRPYSLSVHTRTHTGERPYKCPHCEKTYVQSKDLKIHIQQHTGEKYRCELCGDAFVQQYLLTNHKRDRHGLNIKSNISRLKKFPPPEEEMKEKKVDIQSVAPIPNISNNILNPNIVPGLIPNNDLQSQLFHLNLPNV